MYYRSNIEIDMLLQVKNHSITNLTKLFNGLCPIKLDFKLTDTHYILEINDRNKILTYVSSNSCLNSIYRGPYSGSDPLLIQEINNSHKYQMFSNRLFPDVDISKKICLNLVGIAYQEVDPDTFYLKYTANLTLLCGSKTSNHWISDFKTLPIAHKLIKPECNCLWKINDLISNPKVIEFITHQYTVTVLDELKKTLLQDLYMRYMLDLNISLNDLWVSVKHLGMKTPVSYVISFNFAIDKNDKLQTITRPKNLSDFTRCIKKILNDKELAFIKSHTGNLRFHRELSKTWLKNNQYESSLIKTLT